MYRACRFVSARVVWAIAAAVTTMAMVDGTTAQQAPWNAPPDSMYPMAGANASAPRGPLGRLVKNPDRTTGLPPFALADQSGRIQRYVEPVPGIDLRPHVGQVVVVRHDTGRTLLASQLELPPPPLYPMVGRTAENAANDLAKRPPQQFVRQAQYVDDDDATVELFEEEELPNGRQPSSPKPMPDRMMHPGGAIYPDGAYPVFPGAMPPAAAGLDGYYSEPLQYGMEWLPGEDGLTPCPKCGRYRCGHVRQGGGAYKSACEHDPRGGAHLFADVEVNFLRLHLPESAIGKLSEKYEFSPRFIAGFSGIGPVDGRVRYWLYGRETETIDEDNEDSIRVEFDVLDLEGTHLFCGQRSEVCLAAGIRLARIEVINEEDDADAGTDLLGLTLAADGRTRLASLEAGRLAWVYGGRLSILGGDWGGEDDGFVAGRTRDDNVVCHELYAGLEFGRCYRQLDLRARLAFELQNWRSDVLAASDAAGAPDIESIGVVGPSIRIGAEF